MVLLPFPAFLLFITPVYKVRGAVYLAAVSHSQQIGLLWNFTRREKRVKEFMENHPLISPFSQAFKHSSMTLKTLSKPLQKKSSRTLFHPPALSFSLITIVIPTNATTSAFVRFG